MHIHTVFFWLWRSVTPDQIRQFEQGLDKLTRDPNVIERQIGKPAATNRVVVENSYNYGVILKFANLADHDSYQAGQAHQMFLETCADLFSKVQVYDINSDDR